jgi:hypothetical protein
MALDEANHRLFIGCRNPVKLLVLDIEIGPNPRFRAFSAATSYQKSAAQARISIISG